MSITALFSRDSSTRTSHYSSFTPYLSLPSLTSHLSPLRPKSLLPLTPLTPQFNRQPSRMSLNTAPEKPAQLPQMFADYAQLTESEFHRRELANEIGKCTSPVCIILIAAVDWPVFTTRKVIATASGRRDPPLSVILFSSLPACSHPLLTPL